MLGKTNQRERAAKAVRADRWEAWDPWGELIVGRGSARDAFPWAEVFEGVDPGEAAEAAVLWLVEHGEVAETCQVVVLRINRGAGERWRVTVRVDVYEDEQGDVEAEISACGAELVPAR